MYLKTKIEWKSYKKIESYFRKFKLEIVYKLFPFRNGNNCDIFMVTTQKVYELFRKTFF